ncbi:hypothetical protein IFM89_024420 [Coptis chinensis]|uniref:Uncharacterized protein n=1 Tax=Coptis chinensis TaxID=261450 RepID=A0A835LRA4_9MAGN|nr:hypothetical protein IFM89_024420 [Coptis chinensis]
MDNRYQHKQLDSMHVVWVVCDRTGRVTELNLQEASLQGTLENLDFSSLPKLVYLDLSNNKLTGNIPSQIGTLSRLTHLDLSVNFLTGSLPLSFGNLSRIIELNVSANGLTGELDPLLFTNWTKLVSLGLQNNEFIGTIPRKIDLLTSLKKLTLSYNNIGGSIPPEIGNLKDLFLVALRGNFLIGSIPQSLGNLSNLMVLYCYTLIRINSLDQFP